MNYPVHKERRPWKFFIEVLEQLQRLGPMWLKERGGIVVYENCYIGSINGGHLTCIPARFLAEEDNAMHDAPMEYRPFDGVPSKREQAVDYITLEQYDGDAEKAMAAAFTVEVEPPKVKKGRKA
jgi:hypothetical protein